MCVKNGFCGTSGVAPFDASRESWTAEEFAAEVMRAEGMEVAAYRSPSNGPRPSRRRDKRSGDHFSMLRDAFVAGFGATVCVADFEDE